MKLNIISRVTSKQTQAQRAKSTAMAVIIIASTIVVFCLVATNVMLNNASHQRRILAVKQTAAKQLETNINDINTLASQYKAFSSASTNIIGGSTNGTGPSDGSNTQIVLDALPSQYDFPGLTASVEKILTSRSVQLQSISGTDNESSITAKPLPNPQPITMSFSFGATSNYNNIKRVFNDFQKSIRPFHVVSLQLSGTDAQMTVNASIDTYYQPTKTLSITSKEVK